MSWVGEVVGMETKDLSGDGIYKRQHFICNKGSEAKYVGERLNYGVVSSHGVPLGLDWI